MNAVEFVKKYGWEEAKNILINRRSWVDRKSGIKLTDNSFILKSKTYEYAIGTLYMGEFSDYSEESYRDGEINLLLLQRLVESWELVERLGGLEDAKDEYFNCVQNNEPASHINQAIADVEKCQ